MVLQPQQQEPQDESPHAIPGPELGLLLLVLAAIAVVARA
jgi:hypothetical protein